MYIHIYKNGRILIWHNYPLFEYPIKYIYINFHGALKHIIYIFFSWVLLTHVYWFRATGGYICGYERPSNLVIKILCLNIRTKIYIYFFFNIYLSLVCQTCMCEFLYVNWSDVQYPSDIDIVLDMDERLIYLTCTLLRYTILTKTLKLASQVYLGLYIIKTTFMFNK